MSRPRLPCGPLLARLALAIAGLLSPRLAHGQTNRALDARLTVSAAARPLPMGLGRFEGAQAADDRLDTYWAPPDRQPAWLALDLATPNAERLPVASVTVRWAGVWAARWRLEAAADGRAWREVASGEAASSDPVTVTLAGTDLRGLRWTCDGTSSSGLPCRVAEIEVRAGDGDPVAIAGLAAHVEPGPRVALAWAGRAWRWRVYRAPSAGGTRDGRPPVLLTFAPTAVDRAAPPGAAWYRVAAETASGREAASSEEVRVEVPAAPRPAFAERGIAELFYGAWWSPPEREKMLRWMAQVGLTSYLHAPKQDPFHRTRWREPYPERELAHLAALVALGRAVGVATIAGISPGLTLDPGSAADFEALVTKLESLRAIGFRRFALMMDDVPLTPSAALGAAHCNLVERLGARLAEPGAAAAVVFVPLVYAGRVADLEPPQRAYVEALAACPPEVEIGWTGPQVISATIAAADAAAFGAAIGRPPVVGDNFPVNDLVFSDRLFMGPLIGRAPDLPGAAAGFLANPLSRALAGRVALGTVAAYVRDPAAYDPEAAWRAAIEEVGGPLAAPLAELAWALRSHPVLEPDGAAGMAARRAERALTAALSSGDATAAAAAALALGRAVGRAWTAEADLDRGPIDRDLAHDLAAPARKLAAIAEGGLELLARRAAAARGDGAEADAADAAARRAFAEAAAIPVPIAVGDGWSLADALAALLEAPVAPAPAPRIESMPPPAPAAGEVWRYAVEAPGAEVELVGPPEAVLAQGVVTLVPPRDGRWRLVVLAGNASGLAVQRVELDVAPAGPAPVDGGADAPTDARADGDDLPRGDDGCACAASRTPGPLPLGLGLAVTALVTARSRSGGRRPTPGAPGGAPGASARRPARPSAP